MANLKTLNRNVGNKMTKKKAGKNNFIYHHLWSLLNFTRNGDEEEVNFAEILGKIPLSTL